jgi:thiol-disulfide isomerase/thioredoxin
MPATPKLVARHPTWLLALLMLLLARPAQAQLPPTAPVDGVQLAGRTLEGRPFDLAAQRGKVVLVMFWATDCAVCRDKMAELRRNVAGWRGQPFELVAVATDARRQDVLDYDAALKAIVPGGERFPMLWRSDPAHRDGFGVQVRLPAAYLVDREGRVVERFIGRIPAEAWDRIADLMP